MSSSLRENARALGEEFSKDIVRRMVSLPRNILGGFSRVMNQGIDLIGGRNHPNYPHYPSQHPSNHPPMIQEEWAFLASFEQQNGSMHPFFYACRFVDALKIAQDERKFTFVYIHSPEHPFTPEFCRETLCSEVVVQYLDANFVCWGGLASRGEGLHMATTLRAFSFPFCAVVAPASDDNLAVLQQMEGPVSPAELLEILQRTMEEQGSAFGIHTAMHDEKQRADRRLREEQDYAYLAALHIDQEKERHGRNSSSQQKVLKIEKPKLNQAKKQINYTKPAITIPESSQQAATSGNKKAEITQILIRFPNGERREKSFLCMDKIEAIYGYIDSLGLVAVGSYRLISNFPRKVYGSDQMGTTLTGSGLHPKASLFLELL